MRAVEKLEAVAHDEETERTFPVKIVLREPVEFGRETVAEITVRAGKLGDLKGIRLGGDIPVDAIILVGSRMTGQPIGVIERLGAEDAGELNAIVLGFFGRCLGTGTTS